MTATPRWGRGTPAQRRIPTTATFAPKPEPGPRRVNFDLTKYKVVTRPSSPAFNLGPTRRSPSQDAAPLDDNANKVNLASIVARARRFVFGSGPGSDRYTCSTWSLWKQRLTAHWLIAKAKAVDVEMVPNAAVIQAIAVTTVFDHAAVERLKWPV